MSLSLLGRGQLRLKGNCHTHSTSSDGRLPAPEVVERYRRAGYDFIYLTEHCDALIVGGFPDFAALDSAEFRVMPGVEYRNLSMRSGTSKPAFLLGLGTSEVSHWKEGLGPQATIDAINNDGGIAVLCCTYWSGLDIRDMVDLRDVAGIEIYNAVCENHCSKGFVVMHWDELLGAGRRLWGLAVDDCHFTPIPDFAFGWIVVCADARTPEAISAAVRSGSFFSSCGPEIIEWGMDGDDMTFRCSPVKTITVNSVGSRGHIFRDSAGGALTSARFPLDRSQPYVRVSCCDEHGRWAWTNPVWTDDLQKASASPT